MATKPKRSLVSVKPQESLLDPHRYIQRTFKKYSRSDIARDEPGTTLLMSGDEAAARGAIEAGVRLAASYPGSPVSYVIENLAEAAAVYPSMHVEWTVNEKTGFEACVGAALCGLRSISIMKNAGVRWMLDALAAPAKFGLPGGVVIVTGEDPDAETSEDNMDSSYLAMFAEIPVLEPSTHQELKEFTRLAFELSEQQGVPVMVKSVPRLAYGRGPVTLGPIDHEARERKAVHTRNPFKWALTGYYWPDFLSGLRHRKFHDQAPKELEQVIGRLPKEGELMKAMEAFPHNLLEMPASPRLGIITSGVSYCEVKETLKMLGNPKGIAILKLAVTHPIPRNLVKSFLEKVATVLVVEDIDPFIEDQVRSVAADLTKHIKILGKRTTDIPHSREQTRELIAPALVRSLGLDFDLSSISKRETQAHDMVKAIPPMCVDFLCPACPEGAFYFALRMVLRSQKIREKTIICQDVGCYGLVCQRPLDMGDVMIGPMGSGLGVAAGISHTGYEGTLIATVGDSTFFHASMPELFNAVYNKADVLLIVLDNRTTGNTGHQAHPGAFGVTVTGESTKLLDIAEIVKACQVDYVKVVDPYDYRECLATIREALPMRGVRVIVARRTCDMVVLRDEKLRGIEKPETIVQVNKDTCLAWVKGTCNICLDEHVCTAIQPTPEENKPWVDPIVCRGCNFCVQICPANAFEVAKGEY